MENCIQCGRLYFSERDAIDVAMAHPGESFLAEIHNDCGYDLVSIVARQGKNGITLHYQQDLVWQD